jgi:hypothetical protein
VYLEDCTVCHLADKIAALFNLDVSQIDDMYYKGPNGINVLVTDSVCTIVHLLLSIINKNAHVNLSFFSVLRFL